MFKTRMQIISQELRPIIYYVVFAILFKERIFGIIDKDAIENSEAFKIIFKELWGMVNKNRDFEWKLFFIFYDNIPIHTIKTIWKYLMNSELKMITITPN